MKFLVHWDSPDERELLRLYLAVEEDDEVVICGEPSELVREVETDLSPQCVLLAIDDHDRSFETFERLHAARPDVPVVGGCCQGEVFRIAKFLTAGMRSYVIRDEQRDFLFFVRSMLDGVIEATRAERKQVVAERSMREAEAIRRVQREHLRSGVDCPRGYDVVARYEPQVGRMRGGNDGMDGGDFHGLYRLPSGHIAMMVGDVGDHSLKSCLAIVTTQVMARLMHANRHRCTKTFLSCVNEELCSLGAMVGDGFITLLYAVLDPETHKFDWASAGHPIPVLHDRAAGTVADVADAYAVGLPLGLKVNASYKRYRSSLPPGGRLLLYSDGLTDASPQIADDDAPTRRFSLGGIESSLTRSGGLSLQVTVDRLFTDSEDFTEGVGRTDDASVVIVQRDAEPPRA